MARFGSGISIQSVILSFIFITIVEANCNTNIIFWPIDIETVHYLQYFKRFDNVRRNFCIFFFLIYLGFTYQPILLLHRLGQPQGLFWISINDWTKLMMFYEFVIWISAIYQSLMDTHNSNKYSKLYPHSKILSRLNLIVILGILMETTGFLSSLLSFIFKSLYI